MRRQMYYAYNTYNLALDRISAARSVLHSFHGRETRVLWRRRENNVIALLVGAATGLAGFGWINRFPIAETEEISSICSGMALLSTRLPTTQLETERGQETDAEDEGQREGQGSTTPRSTSQLPLCGPWCAAAEGTAEARCRIDTTQVPCQGETHCRTDCALWKRFVLGPNRPRPVTCDEYKMGMAYPKGAVPCRTSCLPPEVRAPRYPAPTGLGVFCRPGTCSPAGCPLWLHPSHSSNLGNLACPCNWFGAECRDDWKPVTGIRAGRRFGDLHEVILQVDSKHATSLFVDETETSALDRRRAGCLVRIQHLDRKGVPREMVAALVHDKSCQDALDNTPLGEKTELTILVAPSDPALDPTVREVGDRLYHNSNDENQQDGAVSNLFVNPIIYGFANGQYTYFKDYLDGERDQDQKEQSRKRNPNENTNATIKHILVMSTGAGFGAALTAIEEALEKFKSSPTAGKDTTSALKVHFYHGLRRVQDLPYPERLQQLLRDYSDAFDCTLIVSDKESLKEYRDDKKLPDFVQTAVQNAEAQIGQKLDSAKCNKEYTQDVVARDLGRKGRLTRAGVTASNLAVVVVGRYELLNASQTLLQEYHQDSIVTARQGKMHSKRESEAVTQAWFKERVFMNI